MLAGFNVHQHEAHDHFFVVFFNSEQVSIRPQFE